MYPKQLVNIDPRDHLLFDIGYSYALLERAKEVLKEIAECGDYPVSVRETIEDIEEFQTNRLQVRNKIYENAEPALEIERRLAALDKIIEASESVMLSRIPSSALSEALAEAKNL